MSENQQKQHTIETEPQGFRYWNYHIHLKMTMFTMLKDIKTEIFRRKQETVSDITYFKKRISRTGKVTITKMKNSMDDYY